MDDHFRLGDRSMGSDGWSAESHWLVLAFEAEVISAGRLTYIYA